MSKAYNGQPVSAGRLQQPDFVGELDQLLLEIAARWNSFRLMSRVSTIGYHMLRSNHGEAQHIAVVSVDSGRLPR